MFKIVSTFLVFGFLFVIGIKGLSEHNHNYAVIGFGIMFFIAMENL